MVMMVECWKILGAGVDAVEGSVGDGPICKSTKMKTELNFELLTTSE